MGVSVLSQFVRVGELASSHAYTLMLEGVYGCDGATYKVLRRFHRLYSQSNPYPYTHHGAIKYALNETQ
jgi:hypothetical protein